MAETTTTNNAENMRRWLRSCPSIAGARAFRQDYLSETPTDYAIFTVPSTLASHENILGQTVLNDIQTENFTFASKEPYGADTRQNLQNLGFFQAVAAWIIEQNNLGAFPDWDGGTIKSVLPTLTAYPAQVGSSAAKYQISIRVTYRRN